MKKRYWITGGIIAVTLYFIGVLVASLFFSGFNIGDFILIGQIISVFPFGDSADTMAEYYLALMSIVAVCFMVGAFVGAFVESRTSKLKSNTDENTQVVWMGTALLLVLMVFSYFTSPPQYQSISECTSSISKMIRGFNQSACYKEVAARTGDVSICNKFDQLDYSKSKASNIEQTRQYEKYECYMKVGSLKHINVCADIPTDNSIKFRDLKSECYQQAFYNLQSCETVRNDQKEFEFCSLSTKLYYDLSKEELRSLCSTITTSVLKKACLDYEKHDHPWWDFR